MNKESRAQIKVITEMLKDMTVKDLAIVKAMTGVLHASELSHKEGT